MPNYDNMYDVIIIGGGPAGLTAAIYAARARERVLVIEKNEFGGQIALTDKVMNYPGIQECSGQELAKSMKEQAKFFGAELIYADIKDMELESQVKIIHSSRGRFRALSVILAAGATARNAGFSGEKEFKGRGVAYCATCDGPLFTGCEIFVVGGGLSAVEEAIFLSKYSDRITLLVRENDFTCAKSVSDRLKMTPGITVLFHTEIMEVKGRGILDTIVLKDNMTGKITSITAEDPPFGVFVFVGYEPNTAWLPDIIKKDKDGYLVTNTRCETSVKGVCAAGDIRQKSLRQVVTATSDGAVAAVSLETYIKEMHEKLEIPDLVKEENPVIKGLKEKVILKLWLDDSPLAKEMMTFFFEQEELKEFVILEVHEEGREDMILPSVEICRIDGSSCGMHFHAVPKGLEWNSFQMCLFNVAGPGQKMDQRIIDKISKIDREIKLKVLTSLTCPNCPTSVMSAMQIAAFNEHVTAEMFDINHFKKLRFQYQLMSLPALVIDDKTVIVGKMEVEDMLDEIIKIL